MSAPVPMVTRIMVLYGGNGRPMATPLASIAGIILWMSRPVSIIMKFACGSM